MLVGARPIQLDFARRSLTKFEVDSRKRGIDDDLKIGIGQSSRGMDISLRVERADDKPVLPVGRRIEAELAGIGGDVLVRLPSLAAVARNMELDLPRPEARQFRRIVMK